MVRAALVLACATLAAVSLTAAAAPQPPGGFPAGMPSTPMPSIRGCNDSQTAFLREAWRVAHFATWRAERLIAYIQGRPSSERAELWNRDFAAAEEWTPSPRRWFGAYDSGNAKFIREALDKAEKRFRMQGQHVKGVKKLRCGQPIAKSTNEHVDVCPKGNPGSDGPPSAYHFPIGEVVTCPTFWDRAFDSEVSRETRVWNAAAKLVHELFHHLSVDAKYVVDYHADGVGGHKDKKYYGIPNVTYLAEKKRSWARRNNDTYAYFARAAGFAEARFSGSWAPKEAGGTGGLFFDLSGDALAKRIEELAAGGQYLADLETYVRGGQRRYAALWRIGPGSGALVTGTWSQFAARFGELKGTQDLIDVEVYRSGGEWRYLGVYRRKQGRDRGDGGLLGNLTWQRLVDAWNANGKSAWLADVETYGSGPGRRYVAVWRVGSGNGSLLESTDWKKFSEFKTSRNDLEQLVDYEEFVDGGKRRYLGVWRGGARSSQLHRNLPVAPFVDKWKELADRTLIDIEEYSALPIRIP